MKTRILFTVLIFTLCLSACEFGNQTVVNGLHAWIDAPRDGMILPLQAYEIVFHGNDPEGVSQFEVSVNGTVLATLDNSQSGEKLSYLSKTWEPSIPGLYTISVRVKNTKGEWSEPDQITVTIIDSTFTPTHTFTPEITFTPTITMTVTPTPTITPSLTPTITLTPKAPSVIFTDPRNNIGTVYTGASTCGRETVDFYVTVQTSWTVQNVNVKYRLTDSSGSQVSPWITRAMYVSSGQTWLASATPDKDFLSGSSSDANDYRHYLNGKLEYTFSVMVSGYEVPITYNSIRSLSVQDCTAPSNCESYTSAASCNSHSSEGCVWFPVGDSGVCGMP